MDFETIGVALALGLCGISAILFGTFIRIGKIKSWWLGRYNPIVPEVSIYLSIPFGISLIVLAIALVLPNLEDRRTGLDYVGILLVISIILGLWRPKWIIPKWLLWLETNHKDILPLLRDEARHMNGREWQDRVTTMDGLKDWVEEVRRKHNV